jgi:hypothetical protein
MTLQHNRTRPPPGGQSYRGGSQPTKDIALLAGGVSVPGEPINIPPSAVQPHFSEVVAPGADLEPF